MAVANEALILPSTQFCKSIRPPVQLEMRFASSNSNQASAALPVLLAVVLTLLAIGTAFLGVKANLIADIMGLQRLQQQHRSPSPFRRSAPVGGAACHCVLPSFK